MLSWNNERENLIENTYFEWKPPGQLSIRLDQHTGGPFDPKLADSKPMNPISGFSISQPGFQEEASEPESALSLKKHNIQLPIREIGFRAEEQPSAIASRVARQTARGCVGFSVRDDLKLRE